MKGLTGWSDLVPFILDQLLRPIGDKEIMLVILMPNVASPEVSVRSEGIPGGLGIPPVTLEHIRPLQAELTGLSGGHFLPVRVDVLG